MSSSALFVPRLRCASLLVFALTITGCAGSGNNSSNSGTTSTPQPATTPLSITGVAPTDIPVGSADVTLVVTGTGFTSSYTVAVNSVAEPTSYISSTELHATVAAAQLKSGAVLPVSVTNGTTTYKADPASVAVSVDNPVPSLVSVSPTAVVLGAPDTTVTVAGTNFVPGVALSVNGTPRTTSYVSSTQLTAQLAAADFTSAGSLPLNVINPKPGGGTSGTSALLVNNPAPSIMTLAPASITAGAGDTTVTLTGTGLLPSTTVQVNGATHAATVVSGTQLTFVLRASEIATAATLQVTIANSLPGGGTSGASTIAVNNPAPTITTLSPASIVAGAADTTVTLTGTGLLSSTTVQVNGTTHTATPVSGTQLTFVLRAAEIASAATLQVTVANPQPGGGTSPAATISVTSLVPVITALSPSAVPIGSAATTVTITGTGFLSNSTVQFSGSTRTNAAYVSSTQMTLPLTATDLQYAGLYSVTVTNPAAMGGVSKTATFTVQAKTPAISSVTPASLYTNAGALSIIVTGDNFGTSSKVLWNGTPLTTSVYYNYQGTTVTYQLLGTVTPDLLAAKGTGIVTVSTPTAASVSNAVNVPITDPPVPTVTSISPAYAPVKTDTKLTVSGSGFAQGSVISYNGVALTTTFTSANSLSATVPANLMAFPGNGSVTVSTPAPGGGTSSAAALTLYVPVVSNSMVYNPVNGLAYLSIPSTGSTVTGNSIVSIDPATGSLGTPIFVGSEPGVMAVSSDGKTLWVALNGTTAIRKVDLVNGVAGAQYSMAALGSYYSPSLTAILVLPGTTDSVVVANSGAVGLYDAGVLRGSIVNVSSAYALQADASRSEIYVGGYNLQAYTYSSSGLSLKSTGTSTYTNVASSTFDEMQLASGKMFTDTGKVYDPESSALLGTLLQGTTTVSGATFYDSALSQLYVLTNATGATYSGYTQVDLFNPNDYSNTGKTLPWNIPYYTYNAAGNAVYYNPHRLARWGANGLMLHTASAFFSIQSNVVQDQSSALADLGVTVSSSGDTTTGSTTTHTATVTNNGPQPATDVALSLQGPATGVITASTANKGACPSLTGCTFGTLASGAMARVTIQVLQTTAGTGTLNAVVQGSSTDSSAANNSASSSVTVTGATYNLTPTLTAVSPNAVKTGSADTTLTVTGTNFVSGSTVMLGATALTTTFTSSTQLTATIPAANLANLGWSTVSVSTPAPGGGASGSLPLTVYSVVTVGLNHIAYEPFSRKIYASVSTGSSSITGSSVVSVDPLTGTFGTPVTFATAPDMLSISSSGNTLYTDLTVLSSNSSYSGLPFGRIDLAGGTSSTTSIPGTYYYTGLPVQGLAVQPGSENALAVSSTNALPALYDYTSSTKALVQRGSAGTVYYGSCLSFLDATNLLSTYSSIIDYPVSSTGLGAGKSLGSSDCLRITSNTGASSSGKIYNVTSTALTQQGSVVLPNTSSSYQALPSVAVDPSLQAIFYPANTSSVSYGSVDGLISFSLQNYLRTGSLGLSIPTIEGTSYSSYINDVVRWGQDGLALVTSTGHLYLLRGPFVVPQELGSNTAATLSASSASTLARGSGNTLLTLTGSNFQPGVAVTWNGSYRTTTIVDATHVTVALPAADLASQGSGSLLATNPGAPASNTVTVSVQ